MNWGKSIVLVLGLFMGMILSMAIYLMSRPSDDFDPNYYEKGIHFDQDYVRERQVFMDKVEPQIHQNQKTIQIHFQNPVANPSGGNISGKIWIIRPSTGKLDTNFSIFTGKGNEWNLKGDFLAKGNWQLVLEWTQNHHAYLYHKEIFWN